MTRKYKPKLFSSPCQICGARSEKIFRNKFFVCEKCFGKINKCHVCNSIISPYFFILADGNMLLWCGDCGSVFKMFLNGGMHYKWEMPELVRMPEKIIENIRAGKALEKAVAAEQMEDGEPVEVANEQN